MFSSIALASGIAAGNSGCATAPVYLKESLDLALLGITLDDIMFAPQGVVDIYSTLHELLTQYAIKSKQLTAKKNCFFALGGDHACAVGTWSGVAESIKKKGSLGLLWIDAHMDAHTPETSESGNIHGMPLAALLGYGDKRLTSILSPTPKILPSNVALIGIRSYEAGEQALLEKLGVRIYYMPEIRARGLQNVIREAVDIVTKQTIGYGISFDLDSLDPHTIKAVGTPVEDGIMPQEMLDALPSLIQEKLIAFEFVEYNPQRDINGLSLQFIKTMFYQVVQELQVYSNFTSV